MAIFFGSQPLSASAARTISRKPRAFSCTGDTLMLTVSPGHCAASLQTRANTQSPSFSISEERSAIGMNSAGEIIPRTG
jgi:hypothetical protein